MSVFNRLCKQSFKVNSGKEDIKQNYAETETKTYKSEEWPLDIHLVYGLIITGIIGLFSPFLFWIFSPGEASVKDIAEIEKKVEYIKDCFAEAHDYINAINEKKGHVSITSSEKKALETILSGKTSVISFSFLLFLIQAGFFFMLGIILERKLLWPIREKEEAKKEIDIDKQKKVKDKL